MIMSAVNARRRQAACLTTFSDPELNVLIVSLYHRLNEIRQFALRHSPITTETIDSIHLLQSALSRLETEERRRLHFLIEEVQNDIRQWAEELSTEG